METSGQLSDGPLPTLLHQLFVSKATGMVQLNTRMGAHSLYLREGYPVAVMLPGSAELIGKVLLEMGILDEATHKKTMAQPPPKGKRYGDLLIEQGLVTVDQLRLALKAQVRRKLHRLFFLSDGSWGFEAVQHEQGKQGGESLRVHPYRAIYHGVRSAWAAERLSGALFLLEGKAIKLKIPPEESARYGLGADDGRAAELLRKGYWTVADLIEGAGLPAQPVHAMVYSFYITDGLEIQAADAVPRLKRKAGEPPLVAGSPAAPAPRPNESSGAWRMPSGAFTMPQPVTPKSISQPTPSGGTPVPNITPPGGARTPSQPSIPIAGQRTPSQPSIPAGGSRPPSLSNVPITVRSPSGNSYQQLTGHDIDTIRKQIELKAKVVETENLFEVLGLPLTAGREDVKTAYFDAAKRFHPDRLASMGLDALRPEVEKIFRRVSEAYGSLYEDEQRESYRRGLGKPKSDDAEAHAKAMRMLEAEMAFRRGEILLRKNDYMGAIAELELAVISNPSEGEHLAYLTWARLCAGQIDHPTARPIFQEAAKLSPKCARAHYFLGLSLKEANEIDRAYSAFRLAHELDQRMLDAEREMRLINMRKEKQKRTSKPSFLDRLLKK
jgi:curved DNA-binding protein CbpA